jgi:GNAT superfamily N-acetyltransferase
VTIEIHELTKPEEIAALESMVLEYFRIVCGYLKSDFDVQMSPEEPTANMMATPEKFIPPMGRSFVAKDDGALVGMICLKPLQGAQYEIKRLYVRSEARGTGLGKRLVRHLFDVAKDLGATDLYLDSIPSLSAATALYAAEGFEHTDPYPGSEIRSYDMLRDLGVYMHKSLEPSASEAASGMS